MPKYLFQAFYTEAGLKGLLAESGTSRRQAVDDALKGLGGTLEAFYYAFGETDVFVIADLPDNVSSTTFSFITNAAGTAKIKTTVLLKPEEIDRAVEHATEKREVYRPPGIAIYP